MRNTNNMKKIMPKISNNLSSRRTISSLLTRTIESSSSSTSGGIGGLHCFPTTTARPTSAAGYFSSSSPPSPPPPPVKIAAKAKPTPTPTTTTTTTKVSSLSLGIKRRREEKITMVTAYDYPSAVHVARASIDVVLVGDSVAMVELGQSTTQHVSMEQMIHHCQAVSRGIEFVAQDLTNNNNNNTNTKQKPMLVGDMPFGSYEYNDTDIALRNAYKFVQDGNCDAVKLEGGSCKRSETVKAVVDGGVAVMGHVGLTPQAISVIGGFRAQGRTAVKAFELVEDALRLQDSGCFAVVLECVPANVAQVITDTLEIPTIGIGAGPYTTGQVLVFHDMLGMLSHPHHEHFTPKFCKKYAQVGHIIQDSLKEFKMDVESSQFPDLEKYSPYKMSPKEQELFDELLEKDQSERQRQHHDLLVQKLKSQQDEFGKSDMVMELEEENSEEEQLYGGGRGSGSGSGSGGG
eukprot:CAMPEP_0113483206 /NCGR_PEP_ID=MMETSP0014_2-20120614/23314_1 /TAXON_ID=2857 /ORGANISM="Nitzschia sp." /LENGTH=460 /DNA_ID=CAMNT_0000376745 /DNA_START=180 /DNA_END=1562 /DNA_ORIENTATION=- /assembly_acc=CAM_ASM_000159